MRFWKLALAPVMALTFATACTVTKTEEGRAPDVDVDAGKVPEYDVDVQTPDVDVKTDTQTVVVPDVDITTKQDPNNKPGDNN